MTLPDWDASAMAAVAPALDAAAATYGLPRDLVYAIASQESRFNPNATGAAGEIGLMQILPTTAAGVGFGGNADELYDPTINATYGCAYLKSKVDQYGDIGSAVSAYNAGSPTNANATYVGQVTARITYFDSVFGPPADDGSGVINFNSLFAVVAIVAVVVIVVALYGSKKVLAYVRGTT